MSQEEQQQPLELAPHQVADYLQQHPEFFNNHLDLLEQLTIPHPSGNAVSLIAKQLEIFRNRHHEIEDQLTALIEIAKENDALFNRMHELTLSMLDAETLEVALANLQQVLLDCFLADFVVLRIFRKQEQPLQSEVFIDPEHEGLRLFQDILSKNQPLCCRPSLEQAKFLFGDSALAVKSCAIIPLMFTELEGLLVIGSYEAERFHYSMGNLFLTQMGEIIGTRLIALMDNASIDSA
jgi:uncharacterized protein